MNDYPGYMIARPTEYRGVKFRSKSEAVFARALDIGGWVWKYEPEDMELDDGWIPDFWIVKKEPNRPTIISIVVEYKPSFVTKPYLEQLESRFEELGHDMLQTAFALAVGSPWDGGSGRSLKVLDRGNWIELPVIRGQTLDLMEKALDYRFDLKAPS